MKPSMTQNQKIKTDNVRSANVTPQKTGGAARTRKPATKEALEVTGVRRPSSSSARMPSVGERHQITRASVKTSGKRKLLCQAITCDLSLFPVCPSLLPSHDVLK